MKKAIALFLSMVLVSSLTACTAKPSNESTAPNAPATPATSAGAKEPVVLKFPTYMVGTEQRAPLLKRALEIMERDYAGEIVVEVEELPSVQAYIDKMKIQAAARELPPLVHGDGGLMALLISSGLSVDAQPFIDADQKWKDALGDGATGYVFDGKVMCIPESTSFAGYFYNKEMFEQVGIKPATTWDEFVANCDKIKAAGHTPISLMTGENAWTAQLFLGAHVGGSNAATNATMNTNDKIKDFNTPEWIAGFKMMQTLFKDYTTEDAFGAKYADAANNFLSGKTAMIANGPWMTADFSDLAQTSEGFDKKVGAAIYPASDGLGVYNSFGPGYVLTATDPAQQDAAIKFLKVLTSEEMQKAALELVSYVPLSKNVEISAEFRAANPISAELFDIARTAKYKYVYLAQITYPNIDAVYGQIFTALAADKMTPEEAAKKITEESEKNQI